MRITKLSIKKYKNIHDFEWELNPDSPVTVIIGRNASGKTNLLAAILDIFGQCDAYVKGKSIRSGFVFSINYTTIYKDQDTTITFKWENNQYSLYQNDNPDLAIRDNDVLPDRIFTYYAGEMPPFKKIISKYSAWGLCSYLFPQDNQFLLLSMFGSQLSYIKEDILRNLLKIEELVDFTIVLQNPKQKIHSNQAATISNFWNAPPNLTAFYKKLSEVSTKRRTEKTFRNSKLILTISAEGLAKIMEEGYYEYDFFRLLQHSSSLGFIRNIEQFSFSKVGIKEIIGFEDLSEGERQRVGLLGAFSVYQGKETLFLLDEPDAFAHPRWQWEFVPDILKMIGYSNSQQVILATHSPIVLSSLSEPAFMMQEGKISKMNSTFGNSINETLAVQDVPWRESEVADKLKKYLGLIQGGQAQSELAKGIRRELENKLGKNHSELKGVDELIELYE